MAKIKMIKGAKTEASNSVPVTLRIVGGRVRGFTYEMLKALVEDSDEEVYLEGTGPMGEDQGAVIVSCNAADAKGVIDLGGGDTEGADSVRDLIVADREIGQSGCNWTGYADGKAADDAYIAVGSLPMAATIWHSKGFI